MLPVVEALADAGVRGLDRHPQGRRGPCRGRRRSHAAQRRRRVAGRRRRRPRRGLGRHARAGRPGDHAGRPSRTTTWWPRCATTSSTGPTRALAAGVPEVWIDPGIGFGKTTAHNLTLLAHLDELVATGLPVLVGTSRKRFLGELLGALRRRRRARRAPTTGSRARWPRPRGRWPAVRRWCGCTTSGRRRATAQSPVSRR